MPCRRPDPAVGRRSLKVIFVDTRLNAGFAHNPKLSATPCGHSRLGDTSDPDGRFAVTGLPASHNRASTELSQSPSESISHSPVLILLPLRYPFGSRSDSNSDSVPARIRQQNGRLGRRMTTAECVAASLTLTRCNLLAQILCGSTWTRATPSYRVDSYAVDSI